MNIFASGGHAIEYLGLLAGLGSFVVRRVGRMSPRVGWADPDMARFFVVAFVGGVALFIDSHSWLVAVRAAAEGVAWLLCRRGKGLVAVPAVFAAVIMPFASHAAAVQPQAAGAEFADALHVLSAAMWVGGVFALATLRPPNGWKAPDARLLLERFGRVAVIAFGITALTGLLAATEHLNGASDLWTTSYGIVLSLKVVGVIAMGSFAALWRRGMNMGQAEAWAALGVVIATGALAAIPPPA